MGPLPNHQCSSSVSTGPSGPIQLCTGRPELAGRLEHREESLVLQRAWQGLWTRRPATANMYDCNAGTENWVKGWSENKKQWCCSHGYKGCPQDAAMVEGVGYGAGSHGGLTPYGAPVAGHEQGFVPFEVATQGVYHNAVPR